MAAFPFKRSRHQRVIRVPPDLREPMDNKGPQVLMEWMGPMETMGRKVIPEIQDHKDPEDFQGRMEPLAP